jgi:RNA polymerase sigma factor (sigma-70 family)
MNQPEPFYQEFIEPIEDRMLRAVWRVTRDADDAEDALQNALMAILKRRDRIARHKSPPALVLKICVDSAYDVCRRRARDRRHRETHASLDHVRDGSLSPWEQLAERERCSEILRGVGNLSRRQAVAFTLRVFEELPYEQIAAAMACSEATARKHVERARAHLRIVLAKHDPGRITRSFP